MAKGNKEAPQAQATQAAAPVYYVWRKVPRGSANTKHGKDGTQGTVAAMCKYLDSKGGKATRAELDAVAVAQEDPNWVGYAIGRKNRWLVTEAEMAAMQAAKEAAAK